MKKKTAIGKKHTVLNLIDFLNMLYELIDFVLNILFGFPSLQQTTRHNWGNRIERITNRAAFNIDQQRSRHTDHIAYYVVG